MFYKFRNLKASTKSLKTFICPSMSEEGEEEKIKEKKKKKPLFSAYNEPDCVRHCYMFY